MFEWLRRKPAAALGQAAGATQATSVLPRRFGAAAGFGAAAAHVRIFVRVSLNWAVTGEPLPF
jgi:hypothetical protein